MASDPHGKYTAAELARLVGVSVRTVRYYVREGLIDPPTGRGRGPHFTDHHLNQLRRVRLLQSTGLDLSRSASASPRFAAKVRRPKMSGRPK